MSDGVLKRVAALPDMTTDELRAVWQDFFDADPPPYNKPFLVRRLAYRIQELAYGGLSEQTKSRLEALPQDKVGQGQAPTNKRPIERPVTGTRLIREWKGVEHHVTVLEDGFEYQGRPYKSLSAVARTVTGTRWNGPLFFGLRRSGQAELRR